MSNKNEAPGSDKEQQDQNLLPDPANSDSERSKNDSENESEREEPQNSADRSDAKNDQRLPDNVQDSEDEQKQLKCPGPFPEGEELDTLLTDYQALRAFRKEHSKHDQSLLQDKSTAGYAAWAKRHIKTFSPQRDREKPDSSDSESDAMAIGYSERRRSSKKQQRSQSTESDPELQEALRRSKVDMRKSRNRKKPVAAPKQSATIFASAPRPTRKPLPRERTKKTRKPHFVRDSSSPSSSDIDSDSDRAVPRAYFKRASRSTSRYTGRHRRLKHDDRTSASKNAHYLNTSSDESSDQDEPPTEMQQLINALTHNNDQNSTIPKLYGEKRDENGAEELRTWHQSIESYAEELNIKWNSRRLFIRAKNSLMGRAKRMYDQKYADRKQTVSALHNFLLRKLGPPDASSRYTRKLAEMRQGVKESVTSFNDRFGRVFYALEEVAPMHTSERSAADLHHNAVKPQISQIMDVLEKRRPKTLAKSFTLSARAAGIVARTEPRDQDTVQEPAGMGASLFVGATKNESTFSHPNYSNSIDTSQAGISEIEKLKASLHNKELQMRQLNKHIADLQNKLNDHTPHTRDNHNGQFGNNNSTNSAKPEDAPPTSEREAAGNSWHTLPPASVKAPPVSEFTGQVP